MKELKAERYILSTLPLLYLPLYKLDGTSFVSKDGHGYICTSTNANKVYNGFDLNGSNAILTIPNNSNLSNLSALTVIVWAKLDQLASEKGEDMYWIAYKHSAAPWVSFALGVSSADSIFFYVKNLAGADGGAVSSANYSTKNRFVMLTGVYDGDNKTCGLYENIDTLKYETGETGGNSYINDGTLNIGAWQSTQKRLDGIEGLIILYGRSLPKPEWQNIYLETEGRFK